MFIENILKNFFGIGSEDKKELAKKVARSASNLDFEMAIAAHENWKLRLRSFLAGTSSEKFVAEEICFDDRCDLGKWIYSTGRSQLGTFPGFTALMGHNKMFHYAASNVVGLAQVGKIDEAGKILEMQFSQHSSEVVRELQILRTIVRENSD